VDGTKYSQRSANGASKATADTAGGKDLLLLVNPTQRDGFARQNIGLAVAGVFLIPDPPMWDGLQAQQSDGLRSKRCGGFVVKTPARRIGRKAVRRIRSVVLRHFFN
jgi:hypothetical protein